MLVFGEIYSLMLRYAHLPHPRPNFNVAVEWKMHPGSGSIFLDARFWLDGVPLDVIPNIDIGVAGVGMLPRPSVA
jgi:hypothetical protein